MTWPVLGVLLVVVGNVLILGLCKSAAAADDAHARSCPDEVEEP